MTKPFLLLQLAALSAFTALLGVQARAQTQPSSAPATSQPAATTTTATRGGRAGRGAAVARTGAFAPDHNPELPTLFLIGDSTVKNSWDRGTDGLWGWGHPLAAFFDTKKINVDNQALGGTSSHSYLTNNWPGVLALVKKGDFVIMQFGTNDNTAASLRGNGDETQPATGRGAGGEPLHTYGWYIRKYITDTKAKGATPIVCSLVPRMTWKEGKIANEDATHGGWAKEAAAQEKVGFIDLNNLIADQYDARGAAPVVNLFGKGEHVHTNWYGAILNAECVVEGIQKLPDCELNKYLAATPPDPTKLPKPSTDPTPDPSPMPTLTLMPTPATVPATAPAK